MAMVESSCKTQVVGHLYNIKINKSYMYTNKFKYCVAYDFLVVNTPATTRSAFQTNKSVYETLKERLVGAEEAKRRRKKAKKASESNDVVEKNVQRSAHDISVSTAKIDDILEARQAKKLQLNWKQLKFEREKWLMNQASVLLGASSPASEEEKDIVARLMRMKAMSTLAEMFVDDAAKTGKKFVQKMLLPEIKSDINDESPTHNNEEKERDNEDWENAETQPSPETRHKTQEDGILCRPFECNEEKLGK